MSHSGTTLPAGFTRFSTDGLPSGRRIPQWERHNARALVGLAAATDGAAGLRATELNLSLPRLGLARVTGTAHRVSRDEAQVAAHPAGGIVAYLAVRGAGRFMHRGGTETVAPGQGLLIDADQPFERDFAEGLTELAVKVPRGVLAGAAYLAQPRLFEFGGSADAPGARLAAAAGSALSGRPAPWDALEDTLIGLVTELLTDGPAAGHLEAAEAFIRTHYRRRELSVPGIATAIGLSERQLSRVFAASGRSVPQAILAARLEGARRLLGTAALGHLPISDIASRCGFSSQAQFARSYRDLFGVPPLRHRRELLATP
ncbi:MULTISPECIES: AraC family transcriptional regulator [unclassified Arthrobacter]|uniref:helix-turn-helix transcriptional regulator n=1 Tax=unclassified Arthrobacter TaxID=235627 RepID=UPI00159DE05D|nr:MULTISPECIES: AraC family transcriptional regulator [unclassified Arthrobacter]MCQ9165184.1 AraC family transcriptional regulator [Arthrobacter sp. STN4]NVM98082.1 AraC family transcriptional regulator [Arthrobacter sp. SDTb3-6]